MTKDDLISIAKLHVDALEKSYYQAGYASSKDTIYAMKRGYESVMKKLKDG